MQILCELGRFKEKVTRGRFAGNETEYTINVGGDNYSWNINRKNVNAETPPVGQKFFKGFCNLLGYLPSFDVAPCEVIPKIVEALEKNTGIEAGELSGKILQAFSDADNPDDVDLTEIGELIDEHFKCNYNRLAHDSGKLTDPERIYVRVLKANVKTAAKEEE